MNDLLLWNWNHMQINAKKYQSIRKKMIQRWEWKNSWLVAGYSWIVMLFRGIFLKSLTVLANSTIFHIWHSEYVSAVSWPWGCDFRYVNIDARMLMALYILSVRKKLELKVQSCKLKKYWWLIAYLFQKYP